MKFLYILIAILILLIMITVHEFGHYIVGKLFKFKINEFAIGMGPALLKKTKKNGEIFSIRAFPLGGFCAFEGEDEDNENPNAFNNKKPWQRILVLIAGATMNFILALFIIIITFSCYGKAVYQVVEVHDNPSYTQVLQDGDGLLEINGRKIFLSTDLIKSVDGLSAGDTVKVKVLRNGKEITETLTLQHNANAKNSSDMASFLKAIGVATFTEFSVVDESKSPFSSGDYLLYFSLDGTKDKSKLVRVYNEKELIERLIYKNLEKTIENTIGDTITFYTQNLNDWTPNNSEIVNLSESITITLPHNWEGIKYNDNLLKTEFGFETSFYLRLSSFKYKAPFFTRLGESFVYSFKIGGTILETLGELLTGKLSLNSVGGPITTIKTTSQVVSYGFEYILEIIAFIGVNLAVFNLLPIPALDGSRVIFTTIEWIFKKPVPKKVEAIIHGVGLVLLLGFSIMVDILQFF
ncbi:MAG: site-2 protease family protein [Clostridia bacterium]|nr:site-2 protease family protein [Clostridia bacterium]